MRGSLRNMAVRMRYKKGKNSRKPQNRWLYGGAVAAAAIALMIISNTAVPFNKVNMAYAMEQTYKEVKAYHGVLNVAETNEISTFVKAKAAAGFAPKVEVPVDLEAEKGDQKNVDAGHSPGSWIRFLYRKFL